MFSKLDPILIIKVYKLLFKISNIPFIKYGLFI
mgnify:CR=1 FL=1